MSIAQIAALAIEAFLGLLIAYAAYSIFAWTPGTSLTKAREALHYPRWYWVLAGIVGAIGAILLLAGLFLPQVGVIAALWMIAYFVVASFTHLLRKDFAGFGMPVLFLLISGGLLALRWGDAAPLLAMIGR